MTTAETLKTLRRFCAMAAKDPQLADEAFGVAVYKIVVNPPPAPRGPGLEPLLYTVARWSVIEVWRRGKADERRREHFEANAYELELQRTSDPEDDAFTERLRAALHRLNADDVDLIFSTYVARERLVDAAKRLGVNASNVCRRRQAIVERLRAEVAA